MISVELPINSLSLGQVGFGVLMELKKREVEFNFLPRGPVDISSFNISKEEESWIANLIRNFNKSFSIQDTYFSIFHINGSQKKLSKTKNVLWTVHETDQATEQEINILKTFDKVLVTSSYTKSVFGESGVDSEVCPNFFDKKHFYVKESKNKKDDVIIFSLFGKVEKRKRTLEIMNLWGKMFGGNPKYRLHCCVHNNFVSPENQMKMIQDAFQGEIPWNVNLLPFQVKNEIYNDVVNYIDIDLSGLSGAEGWNLPHFQCLALGKHGVTLDAHAHKDFANAENSTLLQPNKKEPLVDGKFFIEGAEFNQGNMFSWDINKAQSAILEAENKFLQNKTNVKGLELQTLFSVEKTVDKILENI